jgi:hypothetical protein
MKRLRNEICHSLDLPKMKLHIHFIKTKRKVNIVFPIFAYLI